MPPIAGSDVEVATLRLDEFRDFAEFSLYLEEQEPVRSARWLYERSLASAEPAITLAGTCGVCLCPARFRSGTAGGEEADGGMVPNWREELACDCEAALINRERGLLHFLLFKRLLSVSTRVVVVGGSRSLNSLLGHYVTDLTCHDGPIGLLSDAAAPPDQTRHGQHHLFIAVDQFDDAVSSPQRLEMMHESLADGGRIVFTAPFNLSDPATVDGEGLLPGWSILRRFRSAGFRDTVANAFWSEEFGYLGLNNFIYQAIK